MIGKKIDLKICGLMREEDVRMCGRLGVDICGFVTEYPLSVPWNLTREQCAVLLKQMSANCKSCLVVGGSLKSIISLAEELRPHYLQLHFREKPEAVETVIKAVKPLGVKVIKNIPALQEERREQFGRDEVEFCVTTLCEIGTDILLVDSRGPSNAANVGSVVKEAFFWEVQKAATVPIMLGGGITPTNCSGMIKKFHPGIIDIMTGVEIAPGVKSEVLVSSVIQQLRALK